MEDGRERLPCDTARDATSVEVKELMREYARLKQPVAELSSQNHILKITGCAQTGIKGRYAQFY